MRHRLPTLILLSAVLTVSIAAPAAAAGKPLRIAFVAPLSGPLEGASREVLAGAESGGRYWSGRPALGRREIEIVPVDIASGLAAVEAALKKSKPLAMVVVSDGDGPADPASLARKLRIPCIVASVWAPPFETSPKDPVFHLAGNAVDHAIAAVAACRIPMKATRVAAIHDGTAGATALAAAFRRNLSPGLEDGGVHVLAEDADARKILAKLATDGVEALFVCGDVPLAVRVAKAADDGVSPTLLFGDGLLGEALAKVVTGEARFLCGTTPDLDEGVPSRYRITRTDKKRPPSPMGVRGYGAVSTLVDALVLAKGRARGMIAALRALDHPKRERAPRFRAWGQSRLFSYELHDMSAGSPAPVRRTYLPADGGGPILGFRAPSAFRHEPGTRIVRVTWGEASKRTIGEDLKLIGLDTAGMDPELEDRVREGIMARTLAWLNRHFRRNADGTAIPNVSFGISFTAAPAEEVPGRKHWVVRLAGGGAPGGRAVSPIARVHTTYIVRTAHLRQALHPALKRSDLDYFTHEYTWGTTADRNIRADEIRCLLEALAGSFGLTAAHEIGHLAGLSHDTSSPRSIMNGREGLDLDPRWAEWVPSHRKKLRSKLKIQATGENGRRK